MASPGNKQGISNFNMIFEIAARSIACANKGRKKRKHDWNIMNSEMSKTELMIIMGPSEIKTVII